MGPGTFEFQVAASNEDGTWDMTPAVLPVVIRPFFYQTNWFLALCVLAALALLWLANRYRIRFLMRRLQQRLEDRHAERERIVRKLHDTYLQTVQTLIIKVQAASHALSEGGTRDGIVRALDLADEALVEGRYRVRDLRSPMDSRRDLVSSLRKVGEQYAEVSSSPSFEVASTDAMPAIDPVIAYEFYASTREAIVNAFIHARARSIRVAVTPEDRGLTVEVVDDGTGFDSTTVEQGGLRDHWGLKGIRERMDRIGGALRIVSEEGKGTSVILFIDAARAYPMSRA